MAVSILVLDEDEAAAASAMGPLCTGYLAVGLVAVALSLKEVLLFGTI